MRRPIGSYISFYWIGLHFIGSYDILSDYIFHVFGSEMLFDQASGFLKKKFASQSAFLDTYQQIWRVTCRVNIEQHKNNL